MQMVEERRFLGKNIFACGSVRELDDEHPSAPANGLMSVVEAFLH